MAGLLLGVAEGMLPFQACSLLASHCPPLRNGFVWVQPRPGGRSKGVGWLTIGGARLGRVVFAPATLYSVDPRRVRTMKQSFASAARPPGRRAHSSNGVATMDYLVVTPATSDRRRQRPIAKREGDRLSNSCVGYSGHLVVQWFIVSAPQHDALWCNAPSLTMRQSAIKSSPREGATSMVVTTAHLHPSDPRSVTGTYPAPVRCPFWNMRNRHASWISPRRTRALPDLLPTPSRV